MIDRFIRALVAVGTQLDFRDIQDILWLAQKLTSDDLETVPIEFPVDDRQNIPARQDALEPSFVDSGKDKGTAPGDVAYPRDSEKAAERNDMTVGVYVMPQGQVPDHTIRASAVRVPSVPALPAAMAIGRSLRPLKRRRAAASRFSVDSEATAVQSADTGVLTPIMKPVMERWFDVALVFDANPSMVVWRDTNHELYHLFARHGAFRDVRRWTLANKGGKALLVSESGLVRHWRELIDPTSRRLILLVTDCTGSHWDHSAVWETITAWGESTPTALIQVLPERLWVSTALGSAPVAASSRIPGIPNTKLDIRLPWWDVSGETFGVPVPVFTLEPAATAAWSKVIMGGSASVAATIALAREVLRPESGDTVKIDPKERLRRFKALVSPTAYQLAVYLSGVPLTLPVMRLVQYAMLPDSRQLHLAEFFLGGLITRTTLAEPSVPADEVEYEFHEHVRDLLQGSMRRSEALRVLQTVSRHLEANYGAPLDFKALIPDAQGHYQLPEHAIPFAALGARLLKRIGGAAIGYASEQMGLEDVQEQEHAPGFEIRQRAAMRNISYSTNGGIDLKVYDNGDHTCLVWFPEDGKPIPNCRGFTIRRLLNGQESYLHGFVGFTDTDKLDPAAPWKFPLQRYMWWDYLVKPGDKVQYSVVPVVGPKDSLALDTENASGLTPEMEITGQSTPHVSAYFNKGIVAAQWVSRALAAEPKNSKIKDLVAKPGDPLRDELSGLLRPNILSLLANAKKKNNKIFAALYELNDVELIGALTAFGTDCNLILANGAFKDNTPGHNDENSAVRAQLKTQINVFDRIVKKGHFGHNKFVVFCDSNGAPQRVLTGSTNWTSSGLCTQANNALIIDDPSIAADFLAAWQRIKAAGNDYTEDLVNGNSTADSRQVDGCAVTPWFVKTSAAQDLEFARKLINSAKEGILFLFFNPGTFQQDPLHWTLLQNILERHNQSNPNFNSDLYFCGVVNQEIAQLTGEGKPRKGKKPGPLDPTVNADPVTLYQNGVESPQRLSHDVLVPHNIKDQFHDWEKELLGASMVNIHSKVIVLDPFGENPVVMTGSHNLGFKASSENDDNLVVVQGNAPLAAAYAINIVAIFQTYRWNSYVEAHRADPKVWHGLVDNDQWQSGHLVGNDKEIKFWLGASASVAPPVRSTPVRRAIHAASAYGRHRRKSG